MNPRFRQLIWVKQEAAFRSCSVFWQVEQELDFESRTAVDEAMEASKEKAWRDRHLFTAHGRGSQSHVEVLREMQHELQHCFVGMTTGLSLSIDFGVAKRLVHD